jgi:nitrite reductase (NO-forming)
MFFYAFLELIAWFIGAAGAIALVATMVRRIAWKKSGHHASLAVGGSIAVAMAVILGFIARHPMPLAFAMPPTMVSHAPGSLPASLPFLSVLRFFWTQGSMERVKTISADPASVPSAPIAPDADGIVRIRMTTKEVIGDVAPGVTVNFWTYDGTVPGPFLRIHEGDTVELTLTNDPSSLHAHNIDLHAVTGPGGGAAVTNVMPGETKTFTWKALAPGLYEYHCAMANVSVHNSHGQYGLILVEPSGGLPSVDREFYVMQGETYAQGGLGRKGLQVFDPQALLDGNPTYVTFNGMVEQAPRMHAKTGERIRVYVGNGGVNLLSSFHVIGEIFDTVYPEGGIGGATFRNIQTTMIPAGGSAIVEFTVDVPGKYLFVDHALARMNKGAWAVLQVEGEPRPDLFHANTPTTMDHKSY